MNIRQFLFAIILLWPFISFGGEMITQTNKLNQTNAANTASGMLVQKYYDTLLVQDLDGFLALLADNVVHEINQGPTEVGKNLFKPFMEKQFSSGKINIKDLIILTSPDGKYASSRFICSGNYNVAQTGAPIAKGQHWEVPVVSFFKIDNGKITHVAVYYNSNEWQKQLKS